MTTVNPELRLGVFTRLLDEAQPRERYRNAMEQIVAAERLGYDSAWVAQHHFNALEGGLPAPAVLLAAVAALTSRIRLGFGVITLPLEHPLRVAEDLAVLDELSDHRVEVGFGTGGTPSSFRAFGLDPADRREIYAEHLRQVTAAWSGDAFGDPGNRLYPPAPTLLQRRWEATFSADGAARIGAAGSGLMLSRSQPRPPGASELRIWQVQEPIVTAYLEHLPDGVPPRIAASRTVFVAERATVARREAERGLRAAAIQGGLWGLDPDGDLDHLIAASDTVTGTSEQVAEQLSRDRVLASATHLLVQVHSVDPVHELVLRSHELLAQEVAPALGIALGSG